MKNLKNLCGFTAFNVGEELKNEMSDNVCLIFMFSFNYMVMLFLSS